ncbi:MAG: ankyrin repeat domain-containing protein, partial [Chlamydiota bacterium]|nr:ankyrin repeat domain-containing protein [Chlamydiota bacterium]
MVNSLSKQNFKNQTTPVTQTTESNNIFFDKLAIELRMKIAHYLNPLDLWNFRQTCKAAKILTDDVFFIKLFYEKLGVINDPEHDLLLPFSKWIHKLTKNIGQFHTSTPLYLNDKSKKLNNVLEEICKSNLIPYLAPITSHTKNLPELTDAKKSIIMEVFPAFKKNNSLSNYKINEIETNCALIRNLAQNALETINASNFYLAHFLGVKIELQHFNTLISNKKLKSKSYEIEELGKIIELIVNRINAKETQLLNRASATGVLAIVNKLIETGLSANQESEHGATPLYIASQNGHLDIVEALIAAEADVNLKNNDGATALFIASEYGHLDIVNELIANEASVDMALDDGTTPLHIASQYGHLDIVKALIASNASVDMATSDGATPLFIASENGHLDIVKALIASNANVDMAYNGATPLYIASQNGHLYVVKQLIANNAGVDMAKSDGATPLYIASQKGYLNIVKALIASKASVHMAMN